MIKNFKWLLFASLAIVACSDEIEEPVVAEIPVTAGSADFSKYVALGNSLTAGFSDGALFRRGQEMAYPKLMADQFALAGGGTFTVPYMNDNIGGLLLGTTPIQGTRLIFNGSAPVPLSSVNPAAVPTTNILNTLSGPFNNLGVPGAKSYHLLAPGYGNAAGVLSGQANPYYVRFRSSASASIIQDAMVQNPTFFSLWIGNNDVLGFATSGGVGVNQLGNLNPATYGGNDISDPTAFANVYGTLVNTLTGNGAKGVVANIPDITTIPHFTTVPHNPVPMTAANATALNTQLINPLRSILSALNAGDRIQPLVAGNNNKLLLVDESLTDLGVQITAIASTIPQLAPLAGFLGSTYGRARHATNQDLVLLATRSVIGVSNAPGPAPLNTWGVTYPLQDQHVLVPVEIQMIKTATTAYNASIRSIADSKGLAFVDVDAIMRQLASTGVRYGNYHMTASFVQGGAFSLDGIHLTARANSYVANKFMEAINMTYGSTLRMYKPEDFPLSYPANLPN
ncbi:MAG: G-D-S-L family lipolytic protein [Flavobacterium sp.]